MQTTIHWCERKKPRRTFQTFALKFKEMNLKHSCKSKLIVFWKGWGYSIFIALIIASSFKSAIADWNLVPTGSMKPTILEGDRIFVNKLAYDLKIPYTTWHIAEWSNPKRGEIVVYYSPIDDKRLVKRVVGLPGDKIAMLNYKLIINGKVLKYEPSDNQNTNNQSNDINSNQICLMEDLTGRKHPVMISPFLLPYRSFEPVIVPAGNYFMMGDNRDNSADSGYFGFVERDRIIGQATAIVASLDINNNYYPRWERFFTKLP
jgi:signal peptidase I